MSRRGWIVVSFIAFVLLVLTIGLFFADKGEYDIWSKGGLVLMAAIVFIFVVTAGFFDEKKKKRSQYLLSVKNKDADYVKQVANDIGVKMIRNQDGSVIPLIRDRLATKASAESLGVFFCSWLHISFKHPLFSENTKVVFFEHIAGWARVHLGDFCIDQKFLPAMSRHPEIQKALSDTIFGLREEEKAAVDAVFKERQREREEKKRKKAEASLKKAWGVKV